MLKFATRHGLKRSSHLAALCRQQSPLPATLPLNTRRCNGATFKTAPTREARKPDTADSSDVSLPPNGGFRGFPHLETNRLKPEKQYEDHSGDKNSTKGKQTRGSTGRTQGARTKPLSEPQRRTGGFTHDQLMRGMQKPRRFRPLLREARLAGADSPRGHLDLNTGKQKKILARNALSTEILEAELRWVARNAPAPRAIRNILRILIEERGIKPTPSHCEALILGQCHPEFGSIENVKRILEAMEEEGIPLEAPILLAALTVLSVHPDMYLRCNILDRLAKQQYALPESYTHLNILATIREGQLEIATTELEKLSRKNQGTPIPRWLWTIYLHAICDLRQDFAALLQLLYRLSDAGFLFPRPTLLHLVRMASKGGDIHVTKFIWHGYVEAMHIIPNEELCLSVLRVAAKEHDLKLAESVAIVLESVAGNTATDPSSLGNEESEKEGDIRNDALNSPRQSDGESPEDVRLASSATGAPTESSHGLEDEAVPSTSTATWTPLEPNSASNSPTASSADTLAIANSTPPSLPDPRAPPPPRPLPTEALRLLAELGIDDFDPTTESSPQSEGMSWLGHERSKQVAEQTRPGRRRRRKPAPGILYPLFREEAGLAGARFDPRLALLRGWDWRKK
ncbi:hypothetical protein H2200_002755 [Cladophialophora chaetospira]|uniref:Pentatricopeptide repeat protein n=1 Tax=Cladophialophora chaetospira TaxID=386627 RepID=A0AA39CNW0_9EURO|nr:hypothetical protein H2200_002755 [Cladophialophora chaetospira]